MKHLTRGNQSGTDTFCHISVKPKTQSLFSKAPQKRLWLVVQWGVCACVLVTYRCCDACGCASSALCAGRGSGCWTWRRTAGCGSAKMNRRRRSPHPPCSCRCCSWSGCPYALCRTNTHTDLLFIYLFMRVLQKQDGNDPSKSICKLRQSQVAECCVTVHTCVKIHSEWWDKNLF